MMVWQVTVQSPNGELFTQVRCGDWRDAAEVAADTAAWWALSAGERGWDATAAESDLSVPVWSPVPVPG